MLRVEPADTVDATCRERRRRADWPRPADRTRRPPPWPAPLVALGCRLCAAVMWTCCAYPAPSVAPAADHPVRPRAARAAMAPGPPLVNPRRRTSDMPAPSRRGQGQWALGHREPLNAAERFKKDDDGLNVRDADHQPVRAPGVRLDRPGRPARPVPLVGPVHPAPPRHRRRQDRRARRRRHRGAPLHDARAHPRRDSCPPGSCARSPGSPRSTAATSPTSPTGRTCSTTGCPSRTSRRSGSGSSRWACPASEACGDVPRNILGCPVAGIDAGRDPGRQRRCSRATEEVGDHPARVHEPAAQVQDHRHRLRVPVHRTRDQRHLVRRRDRPGRDAGLRPVGGRRPVHQPDARPAARRVRRAGPGRRRVGRGDRRLPRLRLPAAAQPGAAEVPGRRLGHRAVPGGAGEGVPGRLPARTARPR